MFLINAAVMLAAFVTPVETLDLIERQVRMPQGAAPLREYQRFYSFELPGRNRVHGVYLHRDPPGRRWVERNDLPTVLDGGCGVITMSYDLRRHRIERIACNGES